MASEEHKQLAKFIKEVHSALRHSSSKFGTEKAWIDHCENKDVLQTYAQCMEKLATTHWENNCADENTEATSRITWAVNMSHEYFIDKSYLKYRERELEIANRINATIDGEELFTTPLKLIDVGSCYNPFKKYDFFDVLAIDLCPANSSVLQCDFLNVSVGLSTEIIENKVTQIKECSFDIVTFCFLLEYIPSSELRINACEKAYNILKFGGLLIINTPDSKHVGANSKIMKCWRYTLACMGFSRIKYEKYRHMHCMAFRKSPNKEVAARWALLHKEPYMEYSINIPQDFQMREDENVESIKTEVSREDFYELPFQEFE